MDPNSDPGPDILTYSMLYWYSKLNSNWEKTAQSSYTKTEQNLKKSTGLYTVHFMYSLTSRCRRWGLSACRTAQWQSHNRPQSSCPLPPESSNTSLKTQRKMSDWSKGESTNLKTQKNMNEWSIGKNTSLKTQKNMSKYIVKNTSLITQRNMSDWSIGKNTSLKK